MNTKVLKALTALVSLIIGYAIVHSFSPVKEAPIAEQQRVAGFFEFNNDAEMALDCVYGDAPYEVHFSAYQRPEVKQPGVNYQRAFCHQLPSLGATKITLDFIGEGLRERSVALTFIHHQAPNPGEEALANGRVLKESFQSDIPKGLILSRLEFSKTGFYTLVVEFGGGVGSENEVVRIPFEVGTAL